MVCNFNELNCKSKGYPGQTPMQLLIFGFHRPAIKIKFLKHCLRDEWIEKIGSEVFFCAVIESDFNDTDVNVRGTVLGIARKKSMDITYLNGLHKEMFYYLYLFQIFMIEA